MPVVVTFNLFKGVLCMAVRWTVTFGIGETRTGLVKIYDSSYSGAARALLPAVNPFSLTRSMKDVCQPVANDSGYLRVIDQGHASDAIEELHPVGGMDRPVEFYIDNVLEWRGFISPDSYSVPLEGHPAELSLPLVGVFQALGGVEMQDNGTGRQTIAAFLCEILEATGFTWAGVRYAEQMEPLAPSWRFSEARLSLSRFNFIRANTSDNIDDPDWTPLVGDNYLTCLEEICRFFGWTAYTDHDVLVLDTLRRDVTTLKSVTWAVLQNMAQSDTYVISPSAGIQRDEISIDDLEWDGVQHRRSVAAGARKVVVISSDNVSQDVYPRLSFAGKTLAVYDLTKTGLVQQVTVHARMRMLDTLKDPVTLHAYRLVNGQVTEVPWAAPVEAELTLPAGSIVKADTWTDDAQASKVNYDYSNFIRLSADIDKYAGVLTHFEDDVPLIDIRSRQIGVFPSGGALCISGQTRNSWVSWYGIGSVIPDRDDKGLSQWGPFQNKLRMSLRVGDMYYNGSTWTSTPAIFEVPAASETPYSWSNAPSDTGNVTNTKTLAMPYNGAFGFIIPVDTNLEGLMELSLYPWIKDTPGASSASPDQYVDFAALFVGNLDVKYYLDSESEVDDSMRLTQLAGDKFRSERQVTLRMSSAPDHKVGLGTMWLMGSRLFPLDYVDSAQHLPEEWLLDTYVRCSSHSLVMMDLMVSDPLPMKPWDTVDYGGRKWAVTSFVVDYADEHIRLTLSSYEDSGS
jgi:hypothetical protein